MISRGIQLRSNTCPSESRCSRSHNTCPAAPRTCICMDRYGGLALPDLQHLSRQYPTRFVPLRTVVPDGRCMRFHLLLSHLHRLEGRKCPLTLPCTTAPRHPAPIDAAAPRLLSTKQKALVHYSLGRGLQISQKVSMSRGQFDPPLAPYLW